MKSKIFVIICALTSFHEASCSLPLFENEFGELLLTPMELGRQAAQEAAQEAAKATTHELLEQAKEKLREALLTSIELTDQITAQEILKRSLGQIALDKARDIAHGIWNSALSHSIRNICTVENYDTYGRRALEAASIIAGIYVTLKGIEHLLGIEATIKKGASKNWGGPLPKAFEELLEAKQNYHVLEQRSVPSHNGYIFHGVPGTGKTLLARVLSDKFQIPLIETNAGKFITRMQGSGNATLKAIINKARSCKAQKPFRCIIFIDEIDALQRNRNYSGSSSGEEDRLMVDLLAEITNPRNSDILFVAATNFIDKIDPALQRDGRLVPLKMELPNKKTREAMIISLLEKYKVDLNDEIITMETLLKKTEGFSSATLDEIIKKALRTYLTKGKCIPGVKEITKEYYGFSTELKSLVEEKAQQNTRETLPEGAQSMYS
jgi:hypothetical protein